MWIKFLINFITKCYLIVMFRTKGYSQTFILFETVQVRNNHEIYHTNFSCGFWHKILIFCMSHIQSLLFLFPLTKSYLFLLLFSIHLNYLTGAGNSEPGISLWSKTTPSPLDVLYLKASFTLVYFYFLFPYTYDSFFFIMFVYF